MVRATVITMHSSHGFWIGAAIGMGCSACSEAAGDASSDKGSDPDAQGGSSSIAGTVGAAGTGAGTAAGGNRAAGGRPAMGAGGAGNMAGAPGTAGAGIGGASGKSGGTCAGLPLVDDYGAPGPFDAKVISNTGPDGTYYLFRPDATLGKDGLKHPVAVWGNGISTTPDQYQTLLGHIASHGIVVIACPSTNAERPCLDSGMEWLVQQNDAEGLLRGKLDTSKEITLGYSWGGGAAIDTADRSNVKATISIHGMPPRGDSAWMVMHSPLLLFTSTGDTFVNADEYVTPNYESSLVPTFYATLDEPVGHLYPIDVGAISCIAGAVLGGPCAGALKEQAPIVAWMRLWACDDPNAKKYFYGPDCVLCQSPWKAQSKPAGAFQ